jgi:hypothetical protein
MKIISALILPIMLSGCLFATAPVLPKFPEAPSQTAMEKCPDLAKIKDDATLSDVAKTVNANYSEYYMCAVKMDIWIEWYQIQRKIFEDMSK